MLMSRWRLRDAANGFVLICSWMAATALVHVVRRFQDSETRKRILTALSRQD
jgi:uncharacterized membrane protein